MMVFCFRLAANIIGIIALTPLIAPLKASSPINSYCCKSRTGICFEAARMPMAMARSKPLPLFGKSAGARLTMILRFGRR